MLNYVVRTNSSCKFTWASRGRAWVWVLHLLLPCASVHVECKFPARRSTLSTPTLKLRMLCLGTATAPLSFVDCCHCCQLPLCFLCSVIRRLHQSLAHTGFIPFEWAVYTRWSWALQPAWYTAGALTAALHKLFSPVKAAAWKVFELLFPLHIGTPSEHQVLLF